MSRCVRITIVQQVKDGVTDEQVLTDVLERQQGAAFASSFATPGESALYDGLPLVRVVEGGVTDEERGAFTAMDPRQSSRVP